MLTSLFDIKLKEKHGGMFCHSNPPPPPQKKIYINK